LGLAALVLSTNLRNVRGAIDDFLADEVCRTVSQTSQDLLTLLTALPRFSFELVRDLFGLAEARNAIDQATAAGVLHRTPTGEMEFHPLIGDFLAKRRGVLPSGELEAFEQRAVAWYVHRAQWDDAFEVVRLSHGASGFSTFISKALRPALEAGRIETVARW